MKDRWIHHALDHLHRNRPSRRRPHHRRNRQTESGKERDQTTPPPHSSHERTEKTSHTRINGAEHDHNHPSRCSPGLTEPLITPARQCRRPTRRVVRVKPEAATRKRRKATSSFFTRRTSRRCFPVLASARTLEKNR